MNQKIGKSSCSLSTRFNHFGPIPNRSAFKASRNFGKPSSAPIRLNKFCGNHLTIPWSTRIWGYPTF